MSAPSVRVEFPGSRPLPIEAFEKAMFDKALREALAQPADEAPWRRLEETVAADEAQARGLLDAYRAQLASELPW